LQTFLEILLRFKVGVTEVVALLHAYRGSANQELLQVRKAEQYLFCQTLSAKNRQTSRKSGRALLMVAQKTWPDPRLEILAVELQQGRMQGLQPIIFAVVAQVALLCEEDTCCGFLHTMVTGLLGAAIRLGVVGHIEAQQILTYLAPTIHDTYLSAATLELEDMWSSTPEIDLAQMRHGFLSTRLFAN
jgi:urease accessory protein